MTSDRSPAAVPRTLRQLDPVPPAYAAAHPAGDLPREPDLIRGSRELLRALHLPEAVGVATVRTGKPHRIRIRVPDARPARLFADALPRSDAAPVHFTEKDGAGGPDPGLPVKLTVRADIPRPAGTHREPPLRVPVRYADTGSRARSGLSPKVPDALTPLL